MFLTPQSRRPEDVVALAQLSEQSGLDLVGFQDHPSQCTAALAASGDAPLIQIRQVGGAINDLAAMATAYAHRTQNFCLNAVGYSLAGLNRRWDTDIQPLMQGRYLSADTDTRPERLHDAFPGPTLKRLRALKAVYDPDNVFNQNYPITPATETRAAA